MDIPVTAERKLIIQLGGESKALHTESVKQSGLLVVVVFVVVIPTACGGLVTQREIQPAPPALEAWSHNHWTAREVPQPGFLRMNRNWTDRKYRVKMGCYTQR